MTDPDRQPTLRENLRHALLRWKRAYDDQGHPPGQLLDELEAVAGPPPDATLLRQAVDVLRRWWPDAADGPPLADVIAHLGYRANILDGTETPEPAARPATPARARRTPPAAGGRKGRPRKAASEDRAAATISPSSPPIPEAQDG